MFGYEAIVFVMGLATGLGLAWAAVWWVFLKDDDDE